MLCSSPKSRSTQTSIWRHSRVPKYEPIWTVEMDRYLTLGTMVWSGKQAYIHHKSTKSTKNSLEDTIELAHVSPSEVTVTLPNVYARVSKLNLGEGLNPKPSNVNHGVVLASRSCGLGTCLPQLVGEKPK